MDTEEESADMVIVSHESITTRPAKSAMKKAWSRLEREEREGSRPARRQLWVRFSLPFAAVFYDREIQLPLYGIIWLHLMKITLDIYIGHITLYNKHFHMCDIV